MMQKNLDSRLPSSQLISLGGEESLRAFIRPQSYGENGVYVQNTLNSSSVNFLDVLKLQGFTFFDWGTVRTSTETAYEEQLFGKKRD